MNRWHALLLVVALACSLNVVADDDGHHHENLTTEQLGAVHFPVSCVTEVQQPFERGVALLHSFWYEEAEKQFTQVTKDDPHCAMAHWGVAMSLWHELWDHPEAKTIKRGQAEVKKAKSLHSRDDRERSYIAAMDAFYGGPKERDYQSRADGYSKAMEQLYGHHPEDQEAAVFYGLSLLASAPDGDTTFAHQKQAAAVLEKVFAEAPDHPGVAHYLIHSYDSPQMAQLGLPAARRYAKIAPAAPHALHMPSHIFARLGLWQDDIDSNLASVAATRKTAAMHMGGGGHQFHAMDFLQYAYLQSGRDTEAQQLIDEVNAMPEMKEDMYGDFDPHVYAMIVFSARYVLEMHHWSDAANLAPVPGASLRNTSFIHWARAIGAARTGNPAQAHKEAAEIDSIRTKLLRDKKTYSAEGARRDFEEAEAWANYADGKHDEALKALRAVAEKEEAEGDEPLAIPAREMLADMLLDMNQPVQAFAEYETDLKFNPNRFDGLYGAAHAAELADKRDQANTYYAQLLKVCDGSKSDRPELSHARALLAQK